jgi:nitrous oxidase accessory protein NosD
VRLRNNVYRLNSVVGGSCTGGNMTFHGQIEGLVVEGNVIEQGPSTPTCYLMSITQGYTSAEWFRDAVVRNNTLVNGGSAIVVHSAPGIVIEGNRVIRTQSISTPAVNIGAQEYAGGDVPDANAIVRGNTLCLAASGASGGVTSVRSPGAVVADNFTRSGADATTGVCAR